MVPPYIFQSSDSTIRPGGLQSSLRTARHGSAGHTDSLLLIPSVGSTLLPLHLWIDAGFLLATWACPRIHVPRIPTTARLPPLFWVGSSPFSLCHQALRVSHTPLSAHPFPSMYRYWDADRPLEVPIRGCGFRSMIRGGCQVLGPPRRSSSVQR